MWWDALHTLGYMPINTYIYTKHRIENPNKLTLIPPRAFHSISIHFQMWTFTKLYFHTSPCVMTDVRQCDETTETDKTILYIYCIYSGETYKSISRKFIVPKTYL